MKLHVWGASVSKPVFARKSAVLRYTGAEPVMLCPPPPSLAQVWREGEHLSPILPELQKPYRNIYIKNTCPIRLTYRHQIFLIKTSQRGAGWPEPGPGQQQEHLGGGHQNTHRPRLRRHLQKLAGALQKVHPPRRRLCQKIFRNKHPPSSNHCQIIHICLYSHLVRAEGKTLRHVTEKAPIANETMLFSFPEEFRIYFCWFFFA